MIGTTEEFQVFGYHAEIVNCESRMVVMLWRGISEGIAPNAPIALVQGLNGPVIRIQP